MDNYKKKIAGCNLGIVALWVITVGIILFLAYSCVVEYKSIIIAEDAIEHTKAIKPDSINSKKLNNPNSFNEDCAINEVDNYYRFDSNDLVSSAKKFYDVTGCQFYYVNLDLESVKDSIKDNKDADEWAVSHIKDLISDDYAVIYYVSDLVEVHNSDNKDYGDVSNLYVSKNVMYGDKAKDLFIPEVRPIVNDIVENDLCYDKYYSSDLNVNEVSFIPLEIARQLFPNKFNKRVYKFEDILLDRDLLVDVDTATDFISHSKVKCTFMISLAVLSIFISISGTVFLCKKSKKYYDNLN